jgi:hypothetical protein
MREVLQNRLEGKQGIELQLDSKEIADSIKMKLRELTPSRP